MKYVLDSNVFKRVAGSRRNTNVDKWLTTVNDSDIYVVSLTLLESQQGIALLKKSGDPAKIKTANDFELEVNSFLADLIDRILPIDEAAARGGASPYEEWNKELDRSRNNICCFHNSGCNGCFSESFRFST